MAATLKVDTRGFQAALTGLSKFSGRDLRHVIRAEAGSILKACAGQTKVATTAKTDKRSIRKLFGAKGLGLTSATKPGDVTINAGIRGSFGRVWVKSSEPHRGTGRGFRKAGFISKPGASFRPENYHWKNSTWGDINEAVDSVKATLKDAIEAGRRAIGLARQSWVQIADDVGIPLESVPGGDLSAAGIAKARAALASNKRPYINGQSREFADNRGYVIELINRLPYGTKIGLDRILAKNINARARFFEKNLETGVFNRLRDMARAYPGLTITRN